VDLKPLLAPGSIAVVGANDRTDSYGDRVLRNLAAAGFDGAVWGVNPKRTEVHGLPCVPSVLDLPEPVDAVVIAIPAAGVPGAVGDAIERGCGGAIVLSAGFGEMESGRGLERELREVALRGNFPVCGPNGNGIAAIAESAPMWGDAHSGVAPGPVAMVSQSGNVAVNALNSRRGIGWHTLVSTGNQAVCDASDWLEAVAELDGVRSVALFCESDGDGVRLAEALAVAAEREVGVAVLKVGSSQAGARAASAHTGALAGDQRVFRALVEEAGAAWAEDPHTLLELARSLALPSARPRRRGGLAVLTCSGGDSGIAADQAELLDIDLPVFAESTRERLDDLLPETATVANPLDWTAMIWDEPERLSRIVATVGEDPAIDQLLLLFDQPPDLPPGPAASWAAVREALVAGAEPTESSAILAATLPDLIDEEVALALAERGFPFVAGLRTALVCARALRAAPGDPDRLREIARAALTAKGRPLSANGWVGEAEAKELLRGAGIEVPAGRVARDAGDAVRAATEVGWPVALKLTGPGVQHKSDAGALALDIAGEGELREAWSRLRELPAADGAELLVERMVPAGVELLIAARADAVVPALVLALGGVWTETLDDVAVVPLPASAERVELALRSLRGAPLLTGARGAEPVDLGALARLGAACGTLLLDEGLGLLELNPVVARPDGAVALDALARSR
jgi:acetate---CoA ligase (ADP-forming)